jgi:integrase
MAAETQRPRLADRFGSGEGDVGGDTARDWHGAAQEEAAALAEHIIPAALQCRTDLTSLRDKAILAFGFATAMRRSELVALNVHLEFTDQGIRVRITRSKTDQCGEGVVIPVVHGSVVCPVKAIRDYIAAAGITEGRLFRSIAKGGKRIGTSLSAQAVANVVKAAMASLGLDPAKYAGHSLRAGFVTSACKKGASQFKVMQTTRHKPAAMLAVYYRDEEIFTDVAGASLL